MTSRTRQLVLTLATLFILLTLSSLVTATLDLVSPADQTSTNQANLTFEYYAAMPNIADCTLLLDAQEIKDITIQNGSFNTFSVLNIDEGSHNWSIRCSNGTDTEYSVVRTLVIDRHAPTLSIITPAENSTVSEAQLSFNVTDETSTKLQCSLSVDNSYVATLNATNGSLTTTPLTLQSGNHVLTLSCFDNATNGVTLQRSFTLEPPLTLTLHTNKQSYALGEQILLTIDTLQDANVSIEVCPDVQGFVQCATPLITAGFPQTLTLPYTNKTGTYLIDGVALVGNRSVTNTTTYEVENTMSVHITADSTPRFGKTVTLQANAVGGIGAVSYEWRLQNGTLVDAQSVTIDFDAPGTWTERVVATDSAGNNASANYTVTIMPVSDLTITVLDASSNTPLEDATVQLGDDTSLIQTTNSEGKAYFTLEEDTYDLFVSRTGYSYYYGSVKLSENHSLTIKLSPNDNQAPVITIKEPANGSMVSPPVTITFHVVEQSASTCTVNYAKEGAQWLQQGETLTVQPNSDASLDLTALSESQYSLFVECTDTSGNIGTSAQYSFTVDQHATQENQVQSDGSIWDEADPLAVTDQAYGAYDSFTQQQRELADLLGFEQRIKEAKLTIERAQRDKESLKFRRDLSEEEKRERAENLTAKIAAAQATIPLDLAILERKETVSYPTPDELQEIAAAIIRDKGFALEPKQLAVFLTKVQNSFSVKTTAYRAKILLPGNKEVPLSLVTHRFSYKISQNGAGTSNVSTTSFTDAFHGTYTLYEAVPEGMAATEKELSVLQEHKTLHQQPLTLEFPPLLVVTYYVEKDVPIETLLGAKSVLLKKPSSEELASVTGHALFVGHVLDWKLSLLLTLLLALLIAVARRFNLLRHFRYLLYAESRKRGLHAIQTVINDGMALLEANNLEQAMMRYKEAKLEYERLEEYAKNEAYPRLLELKRGLDGAYFNLLTRRIQEAMEQGRYEDALDDYARLEGTFEQLGPEERTSLIAIVNELGRRIQDLSVQGRTPRSVGGVSGLTQGGAS